MAMIFKKSRTRHDTVGSAHECVKKKDSNVTAHLASVTANIETHLSNQHHIFGGKAQERQPKKRTIVQMHSQQTDFSAASGLNFVESLKNQFDKDIFQRKLVRWIVETNQSSRVAESSALRDIDYMSPIVSVTNAHLSHDAIKRRINEECQFCRGHIIQVLQQSPSAVHITFDAWTSRNRHPLFGIVAFFLNQEFRPQKIVLGLPNQRERHTGENVAKGVQDILDSFELGQDKVGYFTLDNASNNDKAIEQLAQHYQWKGPMTRRIRCFGYVVHLVVKAMLLGGDLVSDAVEADIDAEAHDAWLRHGPIGKLHNLILCINRSNRATGMLREAQRQDDDKSWIGSVDVIVDNSTRWLSQFYMMSRAIQLRPYIEVPSQICVTRPRNEERRPASFDLCRDASRTMHCLQKTIGRRLASIATSFDISRLALRSLKENGKLRVRKGGKEAAPSLMQDICPAYECLMGHLEESKVHANQLPECAHLRTNINLGWIKLNKYYGTINKSPAYYAATVLHPAIRWEFTHRVCGEQPDWAEKAGST